MMQDKAQDRTVRWLGVTSFCLIFGAFAACAGSETPQIDAEFEAAVADTFGNGSAGSGSTAGGRGGSANAGSANAGSANAGSSSAAGGGAGGAGPAGACDGFGILQEHCGGGNCHGAGTINGNFAENEDIAAAFAGQDPVTEECAAEGPLINTENPRGSLLIQKVNGTVPCGLAMPLVGQLSEEDIDCLEEWIGDL